ncbi:MAG: hypothetical protein LBM27_01310 [Lactobacillaceae bacterium]|jgi:hypothetical protein|nr:hypothetical protein [Lactobacillaceae bacterium]
MNTSNMIPIAISLVAILISTVNSFLNFRQNRFANLALRGEKTNEAIDLFFKEVTPLYNQYLKNESKLTEQVIKKLPEGMDSDSPERLKVVLDVVNNDLIPQRAQILNNLENVSSIANNQPIFLRNLEESIGNDFGEIYQKFNYVFSATLRKKFGSIRKLADKFSLYNLGDDKDDQRTS